MNYPFQNPELPLEDRIQNLLSLLNLPEKISFLYDLSPGVPRLGIKKYYHGNECLHGVVRPGRATVFPQAIAFAATWDPDLIFQVATAISDEARAKFHAIDEYPGTYNGLLTFWSPNVNVLIDPRWGRSPETYGEDPYLTGRIGIQFVKGLQGDHPRYLKVVSTPKHFVANNEEHFRFKLKPKISEKWLRDYFLPGFQPLIVEAKATSIMGAYNAVFDIPCCFNKWLLIDILRNEWGFHGYTVTDCGAIANGLPFAHNYVTTPTQAAASSINAGIDLECGPIIRNGFLLKAVKKKLVSIDRIDSAVKNVLRARFHLGLFDPIEMNPYSKIPFSIVGSEKHSNLALRTAEESIVLLKNTPINGKNLLPLDTNSIKSIAVVGPNANVAQFGDYSGIPLNPAITPLKGIENLLKDTKIQINFVPWISSKSNKTFTVIPATNLHPKDTCAKIFGLKREYYPEPKFKGKSVSYIDETIDFDYRSETADPTISNAQISKTLELKMSAQFSVKWFGFLCSDLTGQYEIKIQLNGVPRFQKAKIKIANSKFSTSHRIFLEAQKKYPIEVQFPYGKLKSRIQLLWRLPFTKDQKNFDREIKAAQENDIVLCFSGLNWGDEHEGIDRHNFELALDQQQLIKSLHAQNEKVILVLIAGSNLSINWEHQHISAILHAWYPGERGGDAIANVLFGIYNPAGRLPLTFYRDVTQLPPFNEYDLTKGKTYWFLRDEPLYPFGYGLSYTEFKYIDIQVDKSQVKCDDILKVTVRVKNSGKFDGEEVIQLYTSYVNRTQEIPLQQLKAFKRVPIKADEVIQIELTLKIADLAFWNPEKKQYNVRPGLIKIKVGSSSACLPLEREILIT